MASSSISISKNSTKERKVIIIPVGEKLISIRGLSPSRLRFEIEYGLERGSTSNSFLFSSRNDEDEKFQYDVLVHPPGATFQEGFIEKLKEIQPNLSKKLLVIVGHINPNRVALLKTLASTYSNTEILCSNPGKKLLETIWQQSKPSKPGINSNEKVNHIASIPTIHSIKESHCLPASNQYNLRLIPAPTARWPGGLIVFEERTGLLMSDKFFGAHLYSEEWAEVNRSRTEEERRHYFDCLMAPMSNQVDGIVERIEELEIRTIAPCHGPSIETSWRSLLKDYQQWSNDNFQTTTQVVLLYASAYGNTAAIADALARGINKTNVKVESYNCEFTPTQQLIKAIQKANAYLIGSPTIGGHAPTPIVAALGTLLAEGDKTKSVGIFGSYGWSGEALDLLESKLRDSGFEFAFEPIKINFSPDNKTIKKLEETGTLFGRRLQKTVKRQAGITKGGMSASKSNPLMQALGRIIGSLCILTTKQVKEDEILTGAMVASWITQASFSPLGISIAIAKDRAVETLLNIGDPFAINILEEGSQSKLMRQFLQPFQPGEDRFRGVKYEVSPTKQPILPEALAWLEGCVEKRMDCGDHWVIYAVINYGRVIDPKGVTAVHHRSSGANY